MKNLSQTKGFTLIELVVVIVILGILAATAAPKFIDLTGDAKKSAMEGVQGTIESAVSMVYAKALIDSKTSGETTIMLDSVYYSLKNGYPTALGKGSKAGDTADNAKGILGLIDIDADDFNTTEGEAEPLIIQYDGSTGDTCRLTYTSSTGAGKRPVIDVSEFANCK
ncbi:hypothetical protein tinsulaeT_12050 [Thalassotalea insulae]|uniref:MSHA pilin protein MshA n=1 Tax=Thalassotalea insulae TaxID=2056778 RepID=A0ABQ6GPF2_9GAMM|nr:type II secretion system protein [Thalassotalea insulae]GLX77865.1 hypothetical protein tinsulaeT_12050 [Thalassotalea insulae]